MSVQSVRIERLNTSNYEVWRVQMRCLLVHHGLWRAVQQRTGATSSAPGSAHVETTAGGDDAPTVAVASTSSTALSAEDKMRACALMLLHVETVYFSVIQNVECPDEMWSILERICRGSVYARKLRLRRQLHSVKMGSGETVNEYIARIRRTVADLGAVGVQITDDEVVPAMLSGLPESFAMVLTVIESSTVDLSIDQVVTQLLNAESRMTDADTVEVHAVTTDKNLANQDTERRKKYAPICHACGKRGHIRKFCRTAPNNSSRCVAMVTGAI